MTHFARKLEVLGIALGVWTLVRGRRARAVDDPTLQVGVYPRGFRLALEGAF